MAVASVVFERHRAAIVAGINRVRRLRRAVVPRQSPIHAPRCPWHSAPAVKLCDRIRTRALTDWREVAGIAPNIGATRRWLAKLTTPFCVIFLSYAPLPI